MIFRAYECRDGACLLVPACLVPSWQAERLHGPLRATGEIDVDQGNEAATLHRILMDIDAQCYARVRRESGRAVPLTDNCESRVA